MGGMEVLRVNKEGDLKNVKYGENQEKRLIWDKRFEEWCINNPNAPTSRDTKVQENLNPWTHRTTHSRLGLFGQKVGHTNVSESVKKTLLKTWIIDCFQEDIVKDPRERSFDDDKWMFDLEIDPTLADDEYDLGCGKKKGICLRLLNGKW
ncbi:hypothetical protein Tco_0616115 [Tanacetum coccineum]